VLKIKDNVELDKLKDYGFYFYDNDYLKIKEWRYSDRGTIPFKLKIREDRTIKFNNPTIKTMEVFYSMVKDDIVELTKEISKKEYGYRTKLELEKKIKQLEEENQKLKDKVGNVE
jgi:hypothetical protein